MDTSVVRPQSRVGTALLSTRGEDEPWARAFAHPTLAYLPFAQLEALRRAASVFCQ
jgi:hypothetical protein